MCSLSIRRLLAVYILVICIPIFAQGATNLPKNAENECAVLLASIDENSNLEIALQHLLEHKLRQTVDPIKRHEFRIESNKSLTLEGLSSGLAKVNLKLGEEILGQIYLGIHNQTLRYDIYLSPEVRNYGLYAGFLKLMIRRFPFIQSIPAQGMEKDRSLNAEIFSNKFGNQERLYGLRESLRDGTLSAHDALELRARILNAFYESPAAKIRTSEAFGELQLLIVKPEQLSTNSSKQLGMDFILNKGLRSDIGARVLVETDNPHQFIQIDFNGQVQFVADPKSEFTDYDAIW